MAIKVEIDVHEESSFETAGDVSLKKVTRTAEGPGGAGLTHPRGGESQGEDSSR
jgi:hypothetical protein